MGLAKRRQADKPTIDDLRAKTQALQAENGALKAAAGAVSDKVDVAIGRVRAILGEA